MAARFWVGGSGNWDASNTANWAATSGGVGGQAVPTSADDVTFDVLSNTTAYTVTVAATANCKSLVMGAPLAGNVTWAGSSALNIFGNLNLSGGANITRTFTGAINFSSTTSQTITTNTVTLNSAITFNGAGGSWQLQDALNNSAGVIAHQAGTWDTNGQTVTSGSYTGSASTTLTLGATAYNCSSDFTLNATQTLTANTATITLSGAAPTFTGTSVSNINNVYFTGNNPNISGALTCVNLKFTGTAAVTNNSPLTANVTVTGLFTVAGNSPTNRFFVKSNVIGTARTINAASVSLTNIDLQDIVGAGAATWSGTVVGNCSGNTGITFTAPVTRYWVAGTGSFSSTAHWSTSTGGSTGASSPLPQDTAVFDSNSVTASKTITIDLPRLPSLNFASITNTPALTFSVAPFIYGDLNLTGVGTFTPLNTTFALYGAMVLTNNSKSFTAHDVIMNGVGGTLTLGDDMTIGNANSLILTNGTFNANNHNLSIGIFSSSNSNVRTLTPGSGTWSITGTSGTIWSCTTATNLTVTASTGLIKFTDVSAPASYTFNGGSKTYNNFEFVGVSGAVCTFSAGDVFNQVQFDTPGTSLLITSARTLTLNRLIANGISGTLLTIRAGTAANPATISCAQGPIITNWLSIKDITFSGGAVWWAGGNTTNVSGNTGIKFYGAARSVGGGVLA